IGVRVGQTQLPLPGFGQRATGAGIYSTILHYSGKGRAQFVTAYGQLVRSQENIPGSFQRADGHARSDVTADVQIAVCGIPGAVSAAASLGNGTLAAVEVLSNSVKPPSAPLTVPLLLLTLALPAVEVSEKIVSPPPALLPTTAPLLLMVPLPAVEVLRNSVMPPVVALSALPLLVNTVMLPAVA